MRGNDHRERSERHARKDSRDGSEHNSSGLQLAKQDGIYLNLTRGGVEEESESREVGGGPRVGSFANANASKRRPPSKTALDRVVPGPVKMGEDPAVGKAGEGNDENVEFAREGLEVIGLHSNFTIAAVKKGERPLPEHVLGVEVGLVQGKVGMGGGGGSEGSRVRQGRCEDRVLGVREIILRDGNNIEGVEGLEGKSS